MRRENPYGRGSKREKEASKGGGGSRKEEKPVRGKGSFFNTRLAAIL